MAKVKITLTKPRDEDWFFISDDEVVNQYFTEEEIANVINPRKELLRNCEGYISSSVLNVDATTKVVTYHFETLENAYRANEIAKLGAENINARKPEDDDFSRLIRGRKLVFRSNTKAKVVVEE